MPPTALEGFAVEYVYENQQGADFFGPTPDITGLAKRRWNFEKAAHYLEREGIDLRRLLEIGESKTLQTATVGR